AWDNATYATKYWLYVGSSQGAYDYYSGGTTGLSACISGLPSASTVYVRLYTISGLFTSYVDSFYQTP
ncbi:MAG: hypothetical protein JW832_16245, partial [Deltaproteobacteria bacterium]|nr:hypothetical protein [Deltaproteobacteria bacterium]